MSGGSDTTKFRTKTRIIESKPEIYVSRTSSLMYVRSSQCCVLLTVFMLFATDSGQLEFFMCSILGRL